MEVVPLVVIQECKSISSAKALKGIEKFILDNSPQNVSLSCTNKERMIAISEDTLAKLSTISASIRSTSELSAAGAKRKSIGTIESLETSKKEKKEKKQKKDKKEKKDKN